MFKKKTEEMLQSDPEENPSSYDKSNSNAGAYIMGVSVLALALAYGMMEIQTLRTKKKMEMRGKTKV